MEQTKTSPSNPLLTYAVWYARRGWPVFPVHTPIRGKCSCMKDCDRPAKHPRWHEGDLEHGVKDATTDPELLKKWWSRWPVANIGIATGQRSFDALDVDVKPEVDGNDTLAELEAKHGRLPDSVEQITGSGGRQILFKHSGRVGNLVKFAPGLDTRSEGGYIVAPPSLHISGRRYEWEVSSRPDAVPLAEAPEWLFGLIHKANGGNGAGDGLAPDISFQVGCHDNTLFCIAWHLAKGGMTEANVTEVVRYLARHLDPGKEVENWARRKTKSAFDRLREQRDAVKAVGDQHYVRINFVGGRENGGDKVSGALTGRV